MPKSYLIYPFLFLLLIAACEPLAPAPTPQIIIVTPPPTNTPLPTNTP
jgi:hypothetical protein